MTDLERLRERVEERYRFTKEEMSKGIRNRRAYPKYLETEAETLNWVLSEIDAIADSQSRDSRT